MVLFPNAKINLGLYVTERRDDGYHNLETIFLPVDLCDILEFVPAKGSLPKLTVTGENLDCEVADNLVIKSWQIMRENFKIPAVEIHLHKLVPAGAGLGGGSSDAAFMLKGLNEQFGCGATLPQLEALAAQIGSDCPFFIRNQPALAAGRGEVLEPVFVPVDRYLVLLVNPGIHVSTREAFSSIKPAVPKRQLKELVALPVSEWQSSISNVFENSVFPLYPEIAEIKKVMTACGALYSSMSGSGSTVYGIFDHALSKEIMDRFRKYYTWIGEFNLAV